MYFCGKIEPPFFPLKFKSKEYPLFVAYFVVVDISAIVYAFGLNFLRRVLNLFQNLVNTSHLSSNAPEFGIDSLPMYSAASILQSRPDSDLLTRNLATLTVPASKPVNLASI